MTWSSTSTFSTKIISCFRPATTSSDISTLLATKSDSVRPTLVVYLRNNLSNALFRQIINIWFHPQKQVSLSYGMSSQVAQYLWIISISTSEVIWFAAIGIQDTILLLFLDFSNTVLYLCLGISSERPRSRWYLLKYPDIHILQT